jgi:hypothetical protein
MKRRSELRDRQGAFTRHFSGCGDVPRLESGRTDRSRLAPSVERLVHGLGDLGPRGAHDARRAAGGTEGGGEEPEPPPSGPSQVESNPREVTARRRPRKATDRANAVRVVGRRGWLRIGQAASRVAWQPPETRFRLEKFVIYLLKDFGMEPHLSERRASVTC